ncbi:type II/IV secretion system protein [Patescibacteria group bacterium]|nr:type II/IV secretion system protein [Patescibacteria group bacterium]
MSTTPPKAASIEDLLKKPLPKDADAMALDELANFTATQKKSPINNSSATPAPAKAAPPAAAQVALTDKMQEIKLREKEKLAQEMSVKFGLPYIALRGFPIAPEALSLIKKQESETHQIVAFFKVKEQIRLGTTNPSEEVEQIRARLAEEQHSTVDVYYISEDSFQAAFKLYDVLPIPKDVVYGYRIDENDLLKYEKQIADFRELQQQIVKVNTTDVITLMIGASLKANASDIHVEAEEDGVKVRFRMDGILNEAAKLPRSAWQQMIGRLKLLSGVKINVDSVPQDGRITIYLPNEKIDIRVSFLPTAFGESVVMRLLRPKAVALEFDNLGIKGLALERLQKEIDRPNGMIVTTGPTGSGKTTTLYAILKKLNDPGVKIITLEDPVEYKLAGINQSQIEHSKDYDFAKGLRSILRQDPDIVMVGEIRDLETAEISIQAALTGHLVVSTIHTNSAAGAIPRFLSMGVKPFLLAPALNAVIGQRLVRRLCPDCKVDATLRPGQLDEVRRVLAAISPKSGIHVDLDHLTFKGPGPGCKTCNNLGFKGRVGIYEIFTMSKEIEQEVLSKEVSEFMIQDMAVKEGMLTMAQDGLLKVLEGATSVEEVLAVANIDSTLLEPPVVETKTEEKKPVS